LARYAAASLADQFSTTGAIAVVQWVGRSDMTRLIKRLWRRSSPGRHVALALVTTPQSQHPWFQQRAERVLELAERR
jgi:hypothetical protein